jgi:hypothetical protein
LVRFMVLTSLNIIHHGVMMFDIWNMS